MQCEKLAPGYWFEGLRGGKKQTVVIEVQALTQ